MPPPCRPHKPAAAAEPSQPPTAKASDAQAQQRPASDPIPAASPTSASGFPASTSPASWGSQEAAAPQGQPLQPGSTSEGASDSSVSASAGGSSCCGSEEGEDGAGSAQPRSTSVFEQLYDARADAADARDQASRLQAALFKVRWGWWEGRCCRRGWGPGDEQPDSGSLRCCSTKCQPRPPSCTKPCTSTSSDADPLPSSPCPSLSPP